MIPVPQFGTGVDFCMGWEAVGLLLVCGDSLRVGEWPFEFIVQVQRNSVLCL